MSITHTLNLSWSGSAGGSPIGASIALTSDRENNVSTTVAGTTTFQQEAISFTKTKLQEIYILSDQTLTLYTNAHPGSSDTITLTAAEPFLWYLNCGWSNPFAGDVTTTFFSNAGTVTANLNVRTLQSN